MFHSHRKGLIRLDLLHNSQTRLSTNHVRALAIRAIPLVRTIPQLYLVVVKFEPYSFGITALATTSPPHDVCDLRRSVPLPRGRQGLRRAQDRGARAAVVAPVAKLGCVPRLKETPSDARAGFLAAKARWGARRIAALRGASTARGVARRRSILCSSFDSRRARARWILIVAASAPAHACSWLTISSPLNSFPVKQQG